MAKSPYIEWHDDFVELKPGFFNSAMDRSVPMTKKRAKAFAELENTLPARLTHEEAERLRWLIFADAPADERRERRFMGAPPQALGPHITTPLRKNAAGITAKIE